VWRFNTSEEEIKKYANLTSDDIEAMSKTSQLRILLNVEVTPGHVSPSISGALLSGIADGSK
jgi:hypothetical protein